MFAKTIIDSDAFLDMPLSAQSLYFHLSMRADDDGFLNNPKKIQRMIGASDDDAKILVMKKFIIPFESGVVVIKHWKIHNYIQNDRYKATVYTEEKSRLSVKKNKAYTLDTECSQHGYSLDAQKIEEVEENVEKCTCIQNGYTLETQDRLELGKDRLELGKDRLDSNNNIYNNKPVRHKHGEYDHVLLTDDDLQKLQEEFPEDWIDRIRNLDEYIEKTGKKYKNHLLVIQSWARKDKESKKHSDRLSVVDEWCEQVKSKGENEHDL